MKELKKDRNGFSAAAIVGVLISVLIAVIIGIALVDTLKSSVGNINGTAKWASGSPVPSLLNLIPLLFILGIVIAAAAAAFVAMRQGMGNT